MDVEFSTFLQVIIHYFPNNERLQIYKAISILIRHQQITDKKYKNTPTAPLTAQFQLLGISLFVTDEIIPHHEITLFIRKRST
jgi:hypothetical protein